MEIAERVYLFPSRHPNINVKAQISNRFSLVVICESTANSRLITSN